MTTSDNQPFEKRTYCAMCLDPVHIGTGGYRLGRVDNTIAREPGTNLPKIPGSSIAGAARAYTAMSVQSENPTVPVKWKYSRPQLGKVRKDDGAEQEIQAYVSCAGKGAEDGDGHCGQHDCEVCIPYGFSRKSGSSFQGLAQFYDARILFFPVHSMLGPLWITTKEILHEFRIAVTRQSGTSLELEADLSVPEEYEVMTSQVAAGANLNLGWLHLKNWKKANPVSRQTLAFDSHIIDRLALVSESIFSCIVNDNLEVRTSVAIDPATGAAEEHALFTYEAIPRGTALWFDVVYNKPEFFKVTLSDGPKEIVHGKPDGQGWTWIKENVEKGLALME